MPSAKFEAQKMVYTPNYPFDKRGDVINTKQVQNTVEEFSDALEDTQ